MQYTVSAHCIIVLQHCKRDLYIKHLKNDFTAYCFDTYFYAHVAYPRFIHFFNLYVLRIFNTASSAAPQNYGI